MELIFFPVILFVMFYVCYQIMKSVLPGKNTRPETLAGDKLVHGRKIALNFLRPFVNSRKKEKGSRFLDEKKAKEVMKPSNKGLLLDGRHLRLTPQDSFTHCMVVAPNGAGKTTRYVIPNVLSVENCSMLITDPSGEIFSQTAGALESKGFDIKVIAPGDPHHSMCYNPLANISSFNQILEISKALVRSSLTGEIKPSEQFWYDGAADLISVLIRCLGVSGRENLHLGNVVHLLQNFGGDGRGILDFIEKYADEATMGQFTGLVTGNEKVLTSYVSTALNSLSQLNDPKLAALMSTNEVEFSDLRKRKTALFIIVPSQSLKHYRFFLNLLYTDFFGQMMETLPNHARKQGKKSLPVYCMMDEFGHMSLPDFAMTCTTIRKYEVSLSIILQNFTQLQTAYGHSEAQTIIDGGMQSKLFFPGLPPGTAKEVAEYLGEAIDHLVRWDGQYEERKSALLPHDRIRTLPDDNAIFITGNKEPILLETLPHFKSRTFVGPLKQKPSESIQRRDLPKWSRMRVTE